MNKCHLPRLVEPGNFSAWARESSIEVLILSSDWYALKPIQRYLHNMASSSMKMADAVVEERTYSYEDWRMLCALDALAKLDPGYAARKAYETWGERHSAFAIMHTENRPHVGEHLLLGDDPCDAADFLDVQAEGRSA